MIVAWGGSRRALGALGSTVLWLGLAVAVMTVGACRGAPPGSGSGADLQSGYSEADDPIVNPPELFEPFPLGQPDRADTDATLMLHSIDSPQSLNPLFLNTWSNGWVRDLLFDLLVIRNSEMLSEPNPDMVESWDVSDDRRTTTVRIKSGLHWHDGKPLTARDIVFSWRINSHPEVPAVFWQPRAGEIAAAEQLDEHTVLFTHRSATAIGTEHLFFPILPEHIWNKPDERQKDPTLKSSEYHNYWSRDEVIGNGPYRLVDWISGDRIVVERWDEYPGPRVHFRRVILKIQPDRNTAMLLFKKGELDEIWLTVQQFATQTEDESFRQVGVKAYGPRSMHGYIGWNMDGSNPFFRDRRVRRALAHAYDRERVLRNVTRGVYTESRGPFIRGFWTYNDEVEPIDYDPERAAALLDDAGWTIDPEDGWRYKTVSGERLRFSFQLLVPQSFVDAVRMADILREDLRRLGIHFDTRVMENASLVDTMRKHEFEAFVATGQLFTDPDLWVNYYHSRNYEQGRNYGGYRNARVDELLDLSRAALDAEERKAYFQQFQELVYADQPNLYLWDYATTWAFSKRVRGVTLAKSGVLNFLPSIRDWWVVAEPSKTPGKRQ